MKTEMRRLRISDWLVYLHVEDCQLRSTAESPSDSRDCSALISVRGGSGFCSTVCRLSAEHMLVKLGSLGMGSALL